MSMSDYSVLRILAIPMVASTEYIEETREYIKTWIQGDTYSKECFIQDTNQNKHKHNKNYDFCSGPSLKVIVEG